MRHLSLIYLSFLAFLESSVLQPPNGSFCFPSHVFDPGEPLTKNLPGPYVDVHIYPMHIIITPLNLNSSRAEKKERQTNHPSSLLGIRNLAAIQPAVSSKKMGAAGHRVAELLFLSSCPHFYLVPFPLSVPVDILPGIEMF